MNNPWVYFIVVILAGLTLGVANRIFDGNDDETDGTTTSTSSADPTTTPPTTSSTPGSSTTTTSSPPGRTVVPDAAATDDPVGVLEAAGLRVEELPSEYSTSKKAGHLITQQPAAGTVVDPGSTVSVVLSLGVEACAGGVGTIPDPGATNQSQVRGDFDGNGVDDDLFVYDLGIPRGWRAGVVLDYGYATEVVITSDLDPNRNQALGGHDIDMDGDEEGVAIVDAGASIDVIGFFSFSGCALERIAGGFFAVGGAGAEALAVICGPPPVVTSYTAQLDSGSREIVEYELDGNAFVELSRTADEISGDIGDSPLECGDVSYSP